MCQGCCWSAVLVAVLLSACGKDDASEASARSYDREVLLDPETCRGCHADHYREWAGSMHAYASKDPVFLAMNRRGQEETNGTLGSFCVNCHAPLALREGATEDGLNLAELPDALQGVTCYFCHNVEAVEGLHNNPLRLSNDTTMRGGVDNSAPNSAHASAYSELFASPRVESAALCGSCHDVLVSSPPGPTALFLERTFDEWKKSIFSPPQAVDDTAALSCNGCHMLPTSGVPIATGGARRTRHAHTFVGVDVPLTQFPLTDEDALNRESSELQRHELTRLLDSTLRLEVCVLSRFTGESTLRVTLDNATAGHHFPSGAAQDRRVFVELRAFADGEQEPFYESGVVPDGEPIAELDDPDLWLLRDRLFDVDGNEVHQFWEAAEQRAATLPVATSVEPLSMGYLAGHAVRQYPTQGTLPRSPTRVTVRVRLEPIGREVLRSLVDSGHLSDATAASMPTLDLLPNRHLTEAAGAPADLARLGSVSFEWGPGTREHGNFRRSVQTTGLGIEECLGMPGRPLPSSR